MLTAGAVPQPVLRQLPPPPNPRAVKPVAPAGELVELTYLTPDRELENRTKEVLLKGFNARMEETDMPYRVLGVVGPATDNDIKTKLTLTPPPAPSPGHLGPRPELLADFVAAGYLADLRPQIEAWADWAQYPEVLKGFAEVGKMIRLARWQHLLLLLSQRSARSGRHCHRSTSNLG